MVKIFLGPSGLGGKEEAIRNLEFYASKGIKACEVAFTYGVYLDEKSAKEIGKKAKELGIVLSIHAPYFVNLNALEKKKLEASKKRILDCCRIGHFLAGVKKTAIVVHSGFYSNMDKEKAYSNIKVQIGELMQEIKDNKWEVILCPEVMGKINVFGSIDEISRLVEETGCGCCIDFAHILARYQGDNRFEEIKKAFGKMKEWHCHYSGIVYGEKGEKNHRHTEEKEWKLLFKFLKEFNKDITIICEAPDPIGDSIEGIEILKT